MQGGHFTVKQHYPVIAEQSAINSLITAWLVTG